MDPSVMVFAPAPQLTITVEQVSDEPELHLHVGGQGIWQARMIASLGVPATVCAVLGGEVGRVLEPLIASEEVTGEPLGRHELDELYDLALTEGLRATVTVLSGPAHPDVVPFVVNRTATT